MYPEFPTLEKIQSSIERFKSKNLEVFRIGEDVETYTTKIFRTFTSEFKLLPYPYKIFDDKKFSLKIFRARYLQAIDDINLISEHSYPPRNIAQQLLRCNFPMNPVFYCANDSGTALAEIIGKADYKNSRFCISSWGLKLSDHKIHVHPFLGDLPDDNLYNIFKLDYLNRLNEHFDNKLKNDQLEGAKEYLNFLSELFLSENYSISASISHGALYGKSNSRPEIIMYQSVQNPDYGLNMAIHPNFVDNHMYLRSLYIIELENINIQTNRVLFKPLAYGETVGSYIEWNNELTEENITTINAEFFGEPIR